MTNRILMLGSSPPSLAARSGYNRVAEHVEGADFIQIIRDGDKNITHKLARRILHPFAISDWYQFSSARLEYRGWRSIRRARPDLVHVLWGDSDLGFMDAICRRAGVPLCCTFHGCADSLPGILRGAERLRRLNGIIVVSKSQVDFFLSQGVRAERISFVPHGIDHEYFHPGPSNPVGSEGRMTVLSVGSYRRNFTLLRGVCERFGGEERVRFEIISSPRHAGMFAGLGNVRFRSGISDRELLQAYRDASCLLMTAEESTANNAVLEAMACGLPIVTERVGGISEYVDAECAVQTGKGDAQELVNAIQALLGNPARRIRMAEASRERALSLSWQSVGRRTEQVYRSILSGAGT